MPAKSEKQRRFMASEHERAAKGQSTKTDMTQKQREDFMRKKKK